MDDFPVDNNGEYYAGLDMPESRKSERIDEEDKVLKAAPLIQEVVAHLREQITMLNSLDSIPVDPQLDPNRHQKLMEINRGIKDGLQNEVDYITNILDPYMR